MCLKKADLSKPKLFLGCFYVSRVLISYLPTHFLKLLKLQDKFSVSQGIVSFLTLYQILHDRKLSDNMTNFAR